MKKTKEAKPDHEIAREELRQFVKELGFKTAISGGEITEDAAKWRHRAWRVSYERIGRRASFDWRAGIGIEGKPDVAEVLGRVADEYHGAKDASFEEWAGNFGYDADSRKAESIWRACLDQGEKLHNLGLTDSDIARLAELDCRL